MLIVARNNVHEKLDDDYDVAFLVPNQSYEVVGIEYGYFRVVTDNLDAAMVHPIYCDVQNYDSVNLWTQKIDSDSFNFTPVEFDFCPYFFEYFHGGNLEYVNVYMRYLNTLFNPSKLREKIYDLYLNAVQDKNFIVSYWLKEWMKSLFKVEKAVDLKKFSEKEWQQKLSDYFGQ